MFKRSSIFSMAICFLSMMVNPLSSLTPYIQVIPFYPPIPLPILARLRGNKRITDLMQKAQKAYQANPKSYVQGNTNSPLTEAENKEIQAAIEALYSETIKYIEDEMQKIANSQKSIVHFRIETDMQLAPGIPLWIDKIFVPTQNLTKEETEQVNKYTTTLVKVQEGFRTVMEKIAKQIPQAQNSDAKGIESLSKGAIRSKP